MVFQETTERQARRAAELTDPTPEQLAALEAADLPSFVLLARRRAPRRRAGQTSP